MATKKTDINFEKSQEQKIFFLFIILLGCLAINDKWFSLKLIFKNADCNMNWFYFVKGINIEDIINLYSAAHLLWVFYTYWRNCITSNNY